MAYIMLTGAIGVALILFCVYKLKRIFIFPLVSIVGVIITTNVMSENIDFDDGYSECLIYGEVLADNATKNENRAYVVKGTTVIYKDTEYKNNEKFYLYKDNNSDKIETGDIVHLEVKVSKLSKKSTNSEYNEFNYYRSNGISYKGTIINCEVIEKQRNIPYFIDCIKKKVFRIFDKSFSEKHSAILKAMITGESEFLSDETIETYKKAGIYHILVISGMHIGIIVGILSYIIKISNEKIKVSAILCIVWGYVVFTGASAPTVRAAIMASMVLIAPLFSRNSDFIVSICVACLLLLLHNPLLLFNAGFLYSFGIVFAIGFIVRPIFEFDYSFSLKKLVVSTVIICFTSRFISANFFYHISNYDIITNIAISFIMSFVIGSGISVVIFGMALPPIAFLMSKITKCLIFAIDSIAECFAELDYSYINVGKPSLFFNLTSMVAFALIVYIIYNRRKYINFRPLSIIILGICIFVNLLPAVFFNDDNLYIDFLYVKEGDCIACSYKNFTFAIDGGANTYIYGKDVKEIENKTLLRFYERKGVEKINCIFVTHTDSDHIDGIMNLLGKKDIGKIFLADVEHNSEKYEILKEKCRKNDVNITFIKNGDIFKIDENLSIKCVYPYIDTTEDENNSSLVLNLMFKDNKFLFTGDIDSKVEKSILNEDISADVLKVAHHGSKKSSSAEFIKKVNPDLAIVSAGENNKYGFPADETIKRFENLKIKLYSTSEFGDIKLISNGTEIKMCTEY